MGRTKQRRTAGKDGLNGELCKFRNTYINISGAYKTNVESQTSFGSLTDLHNVFFEKRSSRLFKNYSVISLKLISTFEISSKKILENKTAMLRRIRYRWVFVSFFSFYDTSAHHNALFFVFILPVEYKFFSVFNSTYGYQLAYNKPNCIANFNLVVSFVNRYAFINSVSVLLKRNG